MEISVNVTVVDYHKFFRRYYFVEKPLKNVLYLLAIVLIITFLICQFFKPDIISYQECFIIVSVATYVLYTVPPYLTARFTIRRNSRLNFIQENYTVVPYKDGLDIKREQYDVFIKWDEIARLIISKNHLFFIDYTGVRYLIPAKYMINEEQAAKLINVITTSVSISGRKEVYQQEDRGKALYKWGLLGIIPILGGASSFILLLKGLFEYRDFKLVGIGLIGVLYSIGIIPNTGLSLA